jgi:hypothetical protein
LRHFNTMHQRKQLFTRTLKTTLLKTGFFLVAFMLFTFSLLAQGPGGDPGGDPDLVPVDGGLAFLLAAGVGYGVKKARDMRKKEK